jgi:hypothetical protein
LRSEEEAKEQSKALAANDPVELWDAARRNSPI